MLSFLLVITLNCLAWSKINCQISWATNLFTWVCDFFYWKGTFHNNVSLLQIIFGHKWRHLKGERDLWERYGGVDISLDPCSFGQANTLVCPIKSFLLMSNYTKRSMLNFLTKLSWWFDWLQAAWYPENSIATCIVVYLHKYIEYVWSYSFLCCFLANTVLCFVCSHLTLCCISWTSMYHVVQQLLICTLVLVLLDYLLLLQGNVGK